MISIDVVYRTVLMLANSDVRGNIVPREFNLAAYDVINEIYEGYFADISRATNRENRGLINSGLENIPDRIRERLLYFLVEDTELVYADGYFALPDDYKYVDTVTFNGAEVEFMKSSREFKLVANYVDTSPTETCPIGLQAGNRIKVAPAAIEDGVMLTYLRKPLLPNWTYTMVNGAEIFNPAATDFRDIDLHPSEENNVVIRILNRFGINLKEQDLVAITQNKTNQDFNLDNAS